MKKILFVFIAAGLIFASPLFVSGKDSQEERGPIEKITFIHYKKGTAKPTAPAKNPGTACYSFMASGAKWKVAEDFSINPANNYGLSSEFISTAINSGVSEWEKYAGNVFGNSNYSSVAITAFDGQNVAYFAPYSDANVIAVTTIWGYFSGRNKEIVEWDMQFNSAYSWGDATINPSLMDLQNIATHELGHSAGLGDIYSSGCSAETMYGYSHEGDLDKRTLNSGDIFGIQKLY